MRETIKQLIPQPLTEVYKKLRYYFIVMLFYIFRLLPINQSKVVFMNIWGFGDNTKYIAEELIKIRDNIDIIYITNNPKSANSNSQIKLLKTNSLSAIYALATAKVWVETNRKEGYIRKRKGQYYIQTWHGGLPLKKIEGDCEEFLGEDYIKRAKWDSSITDLYISNGKFCTQMYKRAFWYSGKILEYGMPRNDILFSRSLERVKSTRKSFGINENVSIAIYAPTYRESGNTGAYLKDITKLHDVLCESTGREVAIIIRLHPLRAADNNIYEYNNFILNGSKSRDMYELMEAADYLITDYSNTMFEFAMMKKPVFLYAKDIEEYEKDRGLYFSQNEIPFPVAKEEEKLWENIKGFNITSYLEETERFLLKAGVRETGMASYKTALYISKILK